MKATAPALVLAAALLSAACGPGRAIFNVDVYSFLAGTGKDTVTYAIPPSSTDSAATFQRLSLPPGFGSSVVESATLTGAADLRNSAGTGTLGFRLYVAADSASTLDSATAFAFGTSNASVSGTNVTPITLSGGLTPAVLQAFTQANVWVRIVAKGQNADPINPVIGKMVLTALDLRVVMLDKIF
jgi:hypothetical protein